MPPHGRRQTNDLSRRCYNRCFRTMDADVHCMLCTIATITSTSFSGHCPHTFHACILPGTHLPPLGLILYGKNTTRDQKTPFVAFVRALCQSHFQTQITFFVFSSICFIIFLLSSVSIRGKYHDLRESNVLLSRFVMCFGLVRNDPYY